MSDRSFYGVAHPTFSTVKYGEQWRLNSTTMESMIPKEGVEMALMEAKGTPDFLLLNTRKNSSLCWEGGQGWLVESYRRRIVP